KSRAKPRVTASNLYKLLSKSAGSSNTSHSSGCHVVGRIGIYLLHQVGEVLVYKKIKNRKKKRRKIKGSNIPKGCLEYSPGDVTVDNSRAQVTSTRNTITHHTSTDESGILPILETLCLL
ncbi:hypothetical protein J6590_065428, partial [Homalodisca vitripennis]